MDRERRMHAAMLAMVDDGVGGVMSALQEKGIDGNTMVFFKATTGPLKRTSLSSMLRIAPATA